MSTRSVKRWESPDTDWVPPEDACELLRAARERQKQAVEAACEKVRDIVAEHGRDGLASVDLTYWHSQEDYEDAGHSDGEWQMANANTRLVAHTLEMRGYDISFGFGGLESLGIERKDIMRYAYKTEFIEHEIIPVLGDYAGDFDVEGLADEVSEYDGEGFVWKEEYTDPEKFNEAMARFDQSE